MAFRQRERKAAAYPDEDEQIDDEDASDQLRRRLDAVAYGHLPQPARLQRALSRWDQGVLPCAVGHVMSNSGCASVPGGRCSSAASSRSCGLAQAIAAAGTCCWVDACHHTPVEGSGSPGELSSSSIPVARRRLCAGVQAVVLDVRRGVMLCSVRHLRPPASAG